MPKFNVVINRTRTIEMSVEFEVSAKDEGSAVEKAEERIQKALDKASIEKQFAWNEDSDDDSFEYDASEA